MQLTRSIGVQAASLLLIAAEAAAHWSAFTTITPCPDCPTSIAPPPITVTKQYQPVSTCATTFTSCDDEGCMTSYSYAPFAYVNTVIPCGFNGTGGTSTSVTTTDQIITVSVWSTTITSYSTITTEIPVTKGWAWGGDGSKTKTTVTPVTTVISKDFCAPYYEIGPFAVPGWPGSGICGDDCDVHSDGSKWQYLNVTECHQGHKGKMKCKKYPETWVSFPASPATTATTETCSSKLTAPSSGTWTFTFPFTAPAPAGPTSTGWSYDPKPWSYYVTKTCDGPSSWDFTTTVTTTVTYTVPWGTAGPSATTNPYSIPTDPSVPGEWGIWASSTTTSSTSTTTTSTTTTSTWSSSTWSTTTSSGPLCSDCPDPGDWADWAETSAAMPQRIRRTLPGSKVRRRKLHNAHKRHHF